MIIGVILAVVFAIAAIALGVFAGMYFEEGEDGKGGVFTILCIIFVVCFVIFPFGFHTVDTGEVAIVKHFGEIRDVKEAGMHYDFWMTNKYVKYDIKVRNVEASNMAYSSDAQTMDVQMTIQYSIMADKVAEIATQYGSIDMLQNRIESVAIEKTKSVLSSYKAMDIIANRATISPAVEAVIKEAVGEEYFVNIETVVLTNIDFSDAFELAVEEKMIAEQAKLKAEYENEKKVAQAAAEAEAKLKAAQAEIEIAQAQADARLKQAQAQIEIAKAEAEALKIEAEAEAAANNIISESITQEILDKILADAWNGELPDVIGSGEYILPADIIS